LTSFIRGLIDEESAEDSEININNKKLIEPYSEQLAFSISQLLNLSIQQKYQPL